MRLTLRHVATVYVVVTAGFIVTLPSATTQDATSTWCTERSHLAVLGASSETGYGTTGYNSPDDG